MALGFCLNLNAQSKFATDFVTGLEQGYRKALESNEKIDKSSILTLSDYVSSRNNIRSSDEFFNLMVDLDSKIHNSVDYNAFIKSLTVFQLSGGKLLDGGELSTFNIIIETLILSMNKFESEMRFYNRYADKAEMEALWPDWKCIAATVSGAVLGAAAGAEATITVAGALGVTGAGAPLAGGVLLAGAGAGAIAGAMGGAAAACD